MAILHRIHAAAALGVISRGLMYSSSVSCSVLSFAPPPLVQISSMLRLKFGGYVRALRPEPLEELAQSLNDLDFCYAVLNKVSRSFAVVIQQLPRELQDPVCIFYLVLRGLDSVEDDMTFDVAQKVPLLQTFHEKLYVDGWTIRDVGDSADYRVLLKYFDKVIRVFSAMEPKYQAVIADITRRMGVGMAEYATKTTSIDTVASYNLYCHYVAGLVGHGLSALFAASGLESPELASPERAGISNSMGLFLQKTNIIRDYLEDLREGRTWWPSEIWSQHSASLEDFASEPYAPKSLACLNHMVTDALSLVPDVLAYLSLIRDQKIFEFCAIPQVMAMATLELCYNNINILRRTGVKIRKGLSCKLMLHATNLREVHGWFHAFANRMEARVNVKDPHAAETQAFLATVKTMTSSECDRMLLGPSKLTPTLFKASHLVAWSVLALGATAAFARSGTSAPATAASKAIASLPVSRPAVDGALAVGSVLSAGFLGGLFGMQYV